ncbi:hypothetical protein TRVL_08613 [Trypanosoma vivax]|nr:hypothetical protein TRVL_08613 [Trypanosoma vivax]
MPLVRHFLVRSWLLLFALFHVSVNGQVSHPSLGPTLFSNVNTVVDLSAVDWDKIHRSASHCPWLILFYNDGCGGCRWFAPRYSNFSTLLKGNYGSDVLQSVTAGAVNCAAWTETCNMYDISSVPHIKFFYPSCTDDGGRMCASGQMKNVALSSDRRAVSEIAEDTRELVKRHFAIDDARLERCIDMHFSLYASKADLLQSAKKEPRKQFIEITDVHATDIAGGFFSILFYDVALSGLQSPESIEALKGFLLLVSRALPSLSADLVINALQALEKRFSVACWRRAVVNAAIPFEGEPRKVVWRTCKGSAPQYRGVPCAMWLLFHSLTVNAKIADDPLNIIQRFIKFFFTCDTCRKHFMEFKFDAKADPVLQLWSAHNSVNARLEKETEGADPLVPKRQFPTREICPECYGAEGGFIPGKVAVFLRTRYDWSKLSRELAVVKSQWGGGGREADDESWIKGCRDLFPTQEGPSVLPSLWGWVSLVGFVGPVLCFAFHLPRSRRHTSRQYRPKV